MLEKWEQESTLMLMGGAESATETLDLNSKVAEPETRKNTNSGNAYDNLFE